MENFLNMNRNYARSGFFRCLVCTLRRHMTFKKAPSANYRFIDRKSVGTFKSKEWIDEGDGLLAATRVNRTYWRYFRRSFPQRVQRRSRQNPWHTLEGLPRSSMLLLGYSVEMFLKSGLARAYHGCREEMFERDIKRKFGHDLVKIANEIAFPLNLEDESKFNLLKKMILFYARYPITVRDRSEYNAAFNQRVRDTWRYKEFEALLNLAKRVRSHSTKIDADKKAQPFLPEPVEIDGDGYIAFRHGGHLPTRITYRLSTYQKKCICNPLDEIIAHIRHDRRYWPINYHWDNVVIYEDGEDKYGKGKTINVTEHIRHILPHD